MRANAGEGWHERGVDWGSGGAVEAVFVSEAAEDGVSDDARAVRELMAGIEQGAGTCSLGSGTPPRRLM